MQDSAKNYTAIIGNASKLIEMISLEGSDKQAFGTSDSMQLVSREIFANLRMSKLAGFNHTRYSRELISCNIDWVF